MSVAPANAAAVGQLPTAFQYFNIEQDPTSRTWSATARVYALASDELPTQRFESWRDAVDAAKAVSQGYEPGHAVLQFGDGFAIAPMRTIDFDIKTPRKPSENLNPTDVAEFELKANVPFHIGNVREGSEVTRLAPLVNSMRFIVDHTEETGDKVLVLQ